MYPHCCPYIGMYPHFKKTYHLYVKPKKKIYPHCRPYKGMYPHLKIIENENIREESTFS